MPHGIRWFALTVKPQHEKAVVAQLRGRDIEGWVPLYRERRRWSDRQRTVELPLFPRYVLARFRLADRPSVLAIPSVTSIVSFGGKPCAVEAREIEAVRHMVASGLPVRPWPLLEIGQPVRISGGVMDGLQGILVREKTAYRVVVNVQLLNSAASVEIERSHVMAVKGARQAPRCELQLRELAASPAGGLGLPK
ncbi:MAG: hypothetical protein LAP87_03125 [Acidobacteriia bacterium]|nr:hypothetical protein [Terriglobia bacterium]